jgi:hypothetical protein
MRHRTVTTVHVLGAVGWITSLSIVLTLALRTASWLPDTPEYLALHAFTRQLTFWVLVPSAVLTLGTSPMLVCVYPPGHRGWWIHAKAALAVAVAALGVLTLIGGVASPMQLAATRGAGVAALCMAVVLSVCKPGQRRARRSGGRHRAVAVQSVRGDRSQ